MSANVIDEYLKKKKERILEYSAILLSRVYKHNPENEEIFEACIDRYINDFVIKKKSVVEIEEANKEFFEKLKIKTQEQKIMIVILLDIITSMEKVVSDKEFIDNIDLFSEALAIAIDLENETTSLMEIDISYRAAIDFIKEKYEPITNEKLEKHITGSNKHLKEHVSANIRDGNKYKALQKENPFQLEYIKLNHNGAPPNDVLEVRLKDKTKELEQFNPKKVEEVITQKRIVYHHTIITIEMLGYKILEIIIQQKPQNNFYVKLPDEFLANKNNKHKMLALTDTKEIREKIGFKIDRRQITKYQETILEIKNHNYQIAASNLEGKEELTDEFKQLVDCIMIDSKSCKDKEEIKRWCNDNQILLVERDVGEEQVVKL